MKTRKTLLLAGIALLLCVYIAQIIFAHRSPTKSYTLKDAPNALTIASVANGTILLTQEDGQWFVTEKKYPADDMQAEQLASLLQNVKSLGVVSRSNAVEELRRYGLDEQTKITVTASKDGKTLRTFDIGKAATTGDQNYARIDGSSETLLVSGDLQDWFTVSVDDLRKSEIYLIDSNDIVAVTVSGDEQFSFSRAETVDGTRTNEWKNFTKAAEVRGMSNVDNAKFSDWVSVLNGFDADAWAADDVALPREPTRTLNILVDNAGADGDSESITIAVYDTGSTEENRRYLCTASTTPYPFYLADNDAKDILKPFASLQ